jgi:tetratricopeptide (TPR) repeat protein
VHQLTHEFLDTVVRYGHFLSTKHDRQKAYEFFVGNLDMARQSNELILLGHILTGLGYICPQLDKNDEARQYNLEAVTLYEELGQTTSLGVPLGNLGRIAAAEKDFDTATFYFEKAYHIAKTAQDDLLVGIVLNNLADIAIQRQNYSVAQTNIKIALQNFHQNHLYSYVFATLDQLAEMALLQQNYMLATIIWGSVEENRRLFNSQRGSLEKEVYEPLIVKLKQSDLFDKHLWQQGCEMTIDDLIEYLKLS